MSEGSAEGGAPLSGGQFDGVTESTDLPPTHSYTSQDPTGFLVSGVWGFSRRFGGRRKKRREEEPAPTAQVPTHGPWATHGPNCKCNVCR